MCGVAISRFEGLLVEGGIAVAPFTEAEEPEQNSKDNETANTANHTPDDCAYICAGLVGRSAELRSGRDGCKGGNRHP